MSGVEGSFSSPGYPNSYPHNKECIWNIRVAPGKSIQLTIHDFDVEYQSSCNFDSLEVGSQIGFQYTTKARGELGRAHILSSGEACSILRHSNKYLLSVDNVSRHMGLICQLDFSPSSACGP